MYLKKKSFKIYQLLTYLIPKITQNPTTYARSSQVAYIWNKLLFNPNCDENAHHLLALYKTISQMLILSSWWRCSGSNIRRHHVRGSIVFFWWRGIIIIVWLWLLTCETWIPSIITLSFRLNNGAIAALESSSTLWSKRSTCGFEWCSLQEHRRFSFKRIGICICSI